MEARNTAAVGATYCLVLGCGIMNGSTSLTFFSPTRLRPP